MNKYLVKAAALCFNCVLMSEARAQSVPAGMPVFDDYYRRMQLLGKVDSNLSFSVRPLLSPTALRVKDVFDPADSLKKRHWTSSAQFTFANGKGAGQILPLSWQQQYNSNHPYGWNDGAIIPARGYQTMISGGLFVKLGPLSIQLRPELVYAANRDFIGYNTKRSATELRAYYVFHNLIDWPERFGDQSYRKASWGQSSIRLTFGALSLGLSNENLWWGPGIRNALILTNNAAGFKHLTINTVKPVKSFLGYFEAQIIGGRLDNSGYSPLPATTLPDGQNLYVIKKDTWRYLSGLNINYHPKWIPNLTLGLIRTFNAYHDDVKAAGVGAYFPLFMPYTKKNVNSGVGDLFPRDQITSLYGRWVFPQALAEIYLEYGWGDSLYNLRDFAQSTEHSRAYVFGLRKMLNLNGNNQHLMVSAEITQTGQPEAELAIREGGPWYVNYQMLHGHTHEGQILGAGTGPGGNLQSIDISWVKGLKKVGIEFERYEHDTDFSFQNLAPINGNSRKWVDFGLTFKGEWDYKNLVFNAKITQVKSLNYQWILQDYTPDQYYIPHNDVYNFFGQLGLSYRF